MRKFYIAIVLILVLVLKSSTIKSQEIHGRVYELTTDNKQEPIVGANVYWLGTQTGSVTDNNGHFCLKDLKTSTKIVISFIGYNSDTVLVNNKHENLSIELKPQINLKEVNITDRNSAYFSMMKPINSQVITTGELRKAACCNLSESFVNNASVDVSYSDAITGAKQIQLLGLSGIYSQQQTENMPSSRGLANGFGLLYVPGTWMESIQISKGTSSVVNGFESIAGQINIEYKKPKESEKFFLNSYGNSKGRIETNIHQKIKIKEHLNSLILAHAETQFLEIDENNDLFLDLPLVKQIHLMNRWDYQIPNKYESKSGIKILEDNRTGGQLSTFNPEFNNPRYEFQNNTRRIDAFTKNGFFFKNPNASLGTIVAASYHQQNYQAGIKKYIAEQKSIYSNLIYENIIKTTDHKINAGASFIFDEYNEQLNDSVFLGNSPIPGAFLQYTLNKKKFTVLLGYRADFYKYTQIIHTPRIHVKYAPHEHTTIRISAGKGYREAKIIAENPSLLLNSRRIVFINQLKLEDAYNYGGNITQKFDILGKDLTINIDFYRTEFLNQAVVDMETDCAAIRIYNLKGKSYSNSFQTDVNYELFKNFDLTLAFRINDVKTTIADSFVEKPFANKYKGLLAFSYATNLKKWLFDANIQYNGEARLPYMDNVPIIYQIEQRSPEFFMINAQITKVFKHWEAYFGSENIGDFVQKKPIVSAEDPFGHYFNASDIWGPIVGRMFYTGIRFSIK